MCYYKKQDFYVGCDGKSGEIMKGFFKTLVTNTWSITKSYSG